MSYILKDHACGYFRGLMDGEDVVWTQEQSRAMRFASRDLADLAMVGHAPNADVIKLRSKKRSAPSGGDTR